MEVSDRRPVAFTNLPPLPARVSAWPHHRRPRVSPFVRGSSSLFHCRLNHLGAPSSPFTLVAELEAREPLDPRIGLDCTVGGLMNLERRIWSGRGSPRSDPPSSPPLTLCCFWRLPPLVGLRSTRQCIGPRVLVLQYSSPFILEVRLVLDLGWPLCSESEFLGTLWLSGTFVSLSKGGRSRSQFLSHLVVPRVSI